MTTFKLINLCKQLCNLKELKMKPDSKGGSSERNNMTSQLGSKETHPNPLGGLTHQHTQQPLALVGSQGGSSQETIAEKTLFLNLFDEFSRKRRKTDFRGMAAEWNRRVCEQGSNVSVAEDKLWPKDERRLKAYQEAFSLEQARNLNLISTTPQPFVTVSK